MLDLWIQEKHISQMFILKPIYAHKHFFLRKGQLSSISNSWPMILTPNQLYTQISCFQKVFISNMISICFWKKNTIWKVHHLNPRNKIPRPLNLSSGQSAPFRPRSALPLWAESQGLPQRQPSPPADVPEEHRGEQNAAVAEKVWLYWNLMEILKITIFQRTRINGWFSISTFDSHYSQSQKKHWSWSWNWHQMKVVLPFWGLSLPVLINGLKGFSHFPKMIETPQHVTTKGPKGRLFQPASWSPYALAFTVEDHLRGLPVHLVLLGKSTWLDGLNMVERHVFHVTNVSWLFHVEIVGASYFLSNMFLGVAINSNLKLTDSQLHKFFETNFNKKNQFWNLI